MVDELGGTPAEAELEALLPRWLAERWPFSDVHDPFNQVSDAASELATESFDPTATPLPPLDREAASVLWRAYCIAHPAAEVLGMDYVGTFGDSVEVADALVGLVVRGAKRATASLVADATEQGPLPRIGGHWVACDGSGAPRVVLRHVELRVGGIDSVDDAFAWDAGEGDRSRSGWLEAHQGRQRPSAAGGQEWDADAEVVFERFDVVWPSEVVKRGAEFARSVAARPVEAAS